MNTKCRIEWSENLRRAAKEHECVYDLLCCLHDSILVDSIGNRQFIGDEKAVEMIQAAQSVADYAAYDRGHLPDEEDA